MKLFLLWSGFIFFALSVQAVEGFESSEQMNIFSIRASISGATASLVNLPNGEQVLTTQAHVLDDFEKYPNLIDKRIMYNIS